jgi:polyhydroxyalkanoate synthesis regulator phasin
MSEDRTDDAEKLRRASEELARRLVRERVDFADRVQEAMLEAERSLTERDQLTELLRREAKARKTETAALNEELEALRRRLVSTDEELEKANTELDLRRRELAELHGTRAYRFAVALRTASKFPVQFVAVPFRLLRAAVTPDRTRKEQ